MSFVAFLVNRVHTDPARERGARPGGRAVVDAELAERLALTLREQQVLARVERGAIARLEVDTRQRPVLVPELEQDIHDLRGLDGVSQLVFGAAAQRAPAAGATR